ncbi:MAG TPA: hypothetical protein VGP47_02155 [Parachlamydiaceae bacterium]|nr:hypothetical protein [Parachlamydiaceae bacterium]
MLTAIQPEDNWYSLLKTIKYTYNVRASKRLLIEFLDYAGCRRVDI